MTPVPFLSSPQSQFLQCKPAMQHFLCPHHARPPDRHSANQNFQRKEQSTKCSRTVCALTSSFGKPGHTFGSLRYMNISQCQPCRFAFSTCSLPDLRRVSRIFFRRGEGDGADPVPGGSRSAKEPGPPNPGRIQARFLTIMQLEGITQGLGATFHGMFLSYSNLH